MMIYLNLVKRLCSLFFLITTYSWAASSLCASEYIDVYLSQSLSQSMIKQSAKDFTVNVPKTMFKGLGHVRPNILKSVSVTQNKDHFQIKFQSNDPMNVSVKNNDKGAQLVIRDKSCMAKSSHKVIVIDAGHGGKDPGTIGVNKINEKDVTLSVAKSLAASLSKYPDFSVYLTRNKDEYVSLRGRIAMAQKKEPDLFISIHADSAPRLTAKGMSIYALSAAGASSEQAKYLADKHNNEIKAPDQAVDGMIFQLTQRASIVSSLQLGSNIIANAGNVPIHINHVEQAAFVVLKAFDIPSVLVEVGFLSSPEDAKRLSSKKGQQDIVKMIETGVFQYFGIKQIEYVVKFGDTLSAISKRFKQSVPDILKLNPGLNANRLKVGAVIKLGRKS
jgi:N-acetylmuramoyl-L-alanine amidase